MERLISSQEYRNEDVVAEKIEAGDFDVFVTPAFEIDGEMVRAITDGHHSLEAAIESGVEPNYIEQSATDNDNIAMINRGEIDQYLEACWNDTDWYYIDSGITCF